MASAYPLFTYINTLPASSTGKRRVKTFHVEDPFEAHSFHLEQLTSAVFARGGLVVPGVDALDTAAKTIQITGYLGISEDVKIALYIVDDTADFSAAGPVKILVVARADPVLASHTYTDPETSESITHEVIVRRGKLTLIEGDATDYPSPGSGDAVIGFLDNTGSTPTFSFTQQRPVMRVGYGPTAQRPGSPPTGVMFFDTDLGKPIWWNGSSWVDATGTAV